MNILNNELVKKYFGCDAMGCPSSHDHLMSKADHMSYAILRAMQEPIRKGERYLVLSGALEVVEEAIAHDYEYPTGHSGALRLPDKFQKWECECPCHNTIVGHREDCCVFKTQPQREAVEEKIKEILWPKEHCLERKTLEIQLRELVKLAREK